MSSKRPKVLIVEDASALAETYVAYLSGEPVDLVVSGSGEEALQTMQSVIPDVVILDVNLPGKNGIEVLGEIRRQGMPAEVIVMTAQGSVNLAVKAMRDGAFDFLLKPFSADRLRVTLRNALEQRRLKYRIESLESIFPHERFCDFIGDSVAMQSVYQILRCAAKSKASVFVIGESGTGKELCAQALHQLSNRKMKPFVALNCAAIPRDLMESEFFGHVKGSFSGAVSDRQGAILNANGGTLFLDEIGEMEVSLQAKILRFLQMGVVQRVGEDRQRQSDVRIVAATNRDIRDEVAAGRFREDLFYRLYVIPVEVPPLRDRDGDVLLIAQHFLAAYSREDGKAFAEFSPETQEALLRYPWPGNVRELQNVIRNVVVLNDASRVELSMLPPDVRGQNSIRSTAIVSQSAVSKPQESILPLEKQIDTAIDLAIEHCGGSIPRASVFLEVSPSTIYRRLQNRGPKRELN